MTESDEPSDVESQARQYDSQARQYPVALADSDKAFAAKSAQRIHALVVDHLDFAWRSLRRLGVREADCDDGCQRVWLVVARRLPEIFPGKERSFIFSVIVRVASEMRRRDDKHNRWDELVPSGEWPLSDAELDPEQLTDKKRALDLLDELLNTLSWEVRIVFVMFELEGFSSIDISKTLNLPRGTVASRLRLARSALTRKLAERQLLDRAPSYPRASYPRASGE